MKVYENKEYMGDVGYIAGLDLPWNKLQDKSVLISGATGLVGSCLVDVIMKRNENGMNCKVYALGRNKLRADERFGYCSGSKLFEFVPYDISTPLVRDDIGTVDYVLHLASNTHPLQYSTDPIGTITTNIFGTYNMLEFAKQHNATRCAFASSNEIYGENRGDVEMFDEHYCGYITEFPSEIMEQKVVLLKKLLSDNFGLPITSNRSGRWATNSEYFQILKRSGILVDCSVTPQLDLSNNVGYSIDCGNDYRRVSYLPYEIVPGLLEVPMTTRRIHSPIGVTVKNRIRNVIKGKELWLRPINAYDDIIRLVDIVESKGDCDYLEFMIHSSELMPGGSPYFKDARAVEEMYTDMNKLFSYLSKKGYVGIGLTEYGLLKRNATEMNR